MGAITDETPPPPPPDWPKEADDDYQRIRILGSGAFGEVWLARSRNGSVDTKALTMSTTTSSTSSRNKANEGDNVNEEFKEFAAIKGVSIRTENEEKTAAREIAILNELNHPNIIRLLKHYEPASKDATGRYMALSFVDGPDVGELLEERGALGLPLAHLITQHLISAIAYCHSRGVLHRDIKGDNILLEGCLPGKKWVHDDLMWSDEKKCKQAIQKGRFKAILADFGLARATTPSDFKNSTASDPVGSDLMKISGEKERFNKSRLVVRGQSAVGTKYFAAPEIQNRLRKKTQSSHALSPCVSDYSMMSDAFSVGVTICEIMTGVPPGQDVDLYVHSHRKTDPQKETCLQKVMEKFGLAKKKKLPHEINLRYMDELPEGAVDLIRGLTEPNVDDRISVRESQNHKWVGGYDALPHGDVPSRPGDSFVFLKSAAVHHESDD